MKNQTFVRRLSFGLSGILISLRNEKSFRTQVFCFALVLLVLLFFRPDPLWWAVLILTSACVLTAELINSSVERFADLVHPDLHPTIKIVKDSLAGAVLVMSLSAMMIFVAFLCSTFHRLHF